MINIFEEAFKANAALDSVKTPGKKIKESIIRKPTNSIKKKIQKESVSLNKIRFVEDFDSQPNEDIMAVYSNDIKPEMTEEEINDAAESLIGKGICKCGICGANYVCSDDESVEDKLLIADENDFAEEDDLEESALFKGNNLMESEETEDSDEEEMICPICGASDNQIIVGEIAPIVTICDDEGCKDGEENSKDETDTNDDNEEESDKTEESDEEEKVDEEEKSDDVDVDIDINIEGVDEEDKEDAVGESVDRADVYSTKDQPNPDPKFIISSNVDGEICKVSTITDARLTVARFKTDDRKDRSRKGKVEYTITTLDGEVIPLKKETKSATKPELEEKTSENKRPIRRESKFAKRHTKTINFDESALNKAFTSFANENYSNVKYVRFTKGNLNNGEIQLEGIVKAKSGAIRKITLESVGFKMNESSTIIKMVEKGPFTESANIKKGKVPFVIECKIAKNTITPVAIKYYYTVNEGNNTYAVKGRNLVESCGKVVKRAKKNELKEEILNSTYELAEYIENQIGDEKFVSLNDFRDMLQNGIEALGVNEYDDLESEVRGILSYNGFSTDFSTGDLVAEKLNKHSNFKHPHNSKASKSNLKEAIIEVDDDYLLELFMDRIRFWTTDKVAIKLFEEMYENYIDDGVYEGAPINIMEIVDNDYVNYCHVYSEGDPEYDEYAKAFEEDERETENGYIEAEFNGSFLVRSY